MNIGIYRSQDSKIIYNSIFSESLFKSFQHDNNVELIMDDNIQICLSKIRQSDLIIFFSHGFHKGIFHRFLDRDGEELGKKEWLIGTNKNFEFLKNKKVIAFSCMTALRGVEGLGELAVLNQGCKVYFGFENSINRDLPEEYLSVLPKNTDAKNLISSVYSIVFFEVLNKAIEKNLSFKAFAQLTKLLLKKRIIKKLLEEYGEHVKLDMHIDAALPVMETANSIFVHGNDKIKFCS